MEEEVDIDEAFANIMAVAREYDAAIIMEPDNLCLSCLVNMHDFNPAIMTPYKTKYKDRTYESAMIMLCNKCSKNTEAAVLRAVTHVTAYGSTLKFGGA